MTENELFKILFEILPFSIYVVDIATYQIIYANRRCIEIHGDCINKTCYETLYKEDIPCHSCRIGELLKSEPNKTLIFERYNEYNECWYQHHEKILRWSDGRLVKYTVELDISSLKAMQNQLAEAHAALALKNKELSKISQYDELTKVFNRSYLSQMLDNTLYNMKNYQINFAVALLNIDDFKKINATYGYLVGDDFLIELTQLINQIIRHTDCFGRWGSEEFMIIIPYINHIDEATHFLESLMNIIKHNKFSIVGYCTCSIGVVYSDTQDTVVNIVKNTENALYLAKAQGKNQIVIYNNS